MPTLSVAENIFLGDYPKVGPFIARRRMEAEAAELLKRVGFDEVTSGLAVGEVSELNQRRVAIARALSCEAEVIIADEPTAGLDADDAAVVLDLLKKFKRDADRKRAIIVVTTNPEVADAMDHSVELD